MLELRNKMRQETSFKINELLDHNPDSSNLNYNPESSTPDWNINLIYKISKVEDIYIRGILYNFKTNSYQNYLFNNKLLINSKKWRRRPTDIPGLFCIFCEKYYQNATPNTQSLISDMVFKCWSCNICR